MNAGNITSVWLLAISLVVLGPPIFLIVVFGRFFKAVRMLEGINHKMGILVTAAEGRGDIEFIEEKPVIDRLVDRFMSRWEN